MGLLSNFRHKFHNAFFTQVLYGTVASLAIFLTSWDHLDRMRDRFQTKLQNDTDTFDFVIVGAGTGGSVVANRLSQYYSVLLLESGGEPHPFQAVPGLSLFMPNHPEVDWMHRSVPQKRAFGNSLKREASLSQGKGLGGSGNLNFLNYMRGSPLDYEHWKNITNDGSWGYSEMRKYFQLVEDYSKENTHKRQGAVKLDIPDYVGLSAEFITAADQLGYKHVDLNENFVEGFDVNYFPIYKGIRQAPYQSYLKTARGRKSLTIRKFSNVNRILFRENSTQAYGVEYERHGEVKIAKAAKEVILSAGALKTPEILLRSGVGPSEHLQDIGIPLRLNLPVGRNLQDHISTLVGPFFIKEHRSLLLGKDIDTGTFLEWGMDGKGPLTSSFYQASGLILSSFAKSREEDHNWPDIHLQLSSIAVHKNYAADLAHAYNLQENLLAQYYTHAAGRQSFSISVTNSRPVARGEVLLTGQDTKDKLLINPKYLEDSYNLDINILKDGVKTALKLAENSTAFQKIGARFTDKQLPGCEHVQFRSDAYWECYIRQFSLSMHAYCGTAAMGKVTSKYSVVDSQLKVIGAKGLRVIDASVIPSITVGSPQGAVLAIAEKGADNILQYWRQFDVPSKTYDDNEASNSSTNGSPKDDFSDSFSGFSYLGKFTRVTNVSSNNNNKSRNGNARKISKHKIGTKSAAAGQSRNNNRVVVSTSTTTTTTSTTTQKPDFEQAETRFSHNLSQIMEFLRNSRAINEAIDDETYNDLVQNFGERIVELMKKNKTDIFFVPPTTTTTYRPESDDDAGSANTTAKLGQSSSSSSSSKNVFSSKFSSGKSDDKSSTQKNGKQYRPFQFSTTTSKPSPRSITTVTSKLSMYHLKNNGTSQPKVTTSIPKSSSAFPSPSSFSSTSAKFAPAKFSPLISSKASSKPATVVTVAPKKLTSPSFTTSIKPYSTILSSTFRPTTTAIDTLFSNSPKSEEEDEGDDTEDATSFDDEETTAKPEELKVKPSTKLVELILNQDFTVNKTKEIDSATYTALTSSSSVVSSEKKNGKQRELIEYRTVEERRPFSAYPPYKILSVPGQEFVPTGVLVPPFHHHHHHLNSPAQILPPISSSSIVFQAAAPAIASLTPPPQIISQHHHHHPLPSLAQYQQAQLLAPPKLPSVIDENLPIQTAKTVLYYTQVSPRDPNEIRNSEIIANFASTHNGNNGGRVVSSSLSLPSNLHREDQSQNIVQFLPSIN